MSDDDQIAILPLDEVRTMAIRSVPDQVILRITSGADQRHYLLPVADLERLAERLQADALLLRPARAASA